jgi:hypothetical protein
MPSRKLHDITVQFVHMTEKAIKYTDGETEFWVPKSIMGDDGYVQVEDNKDGTSTLTAPEWWLKDKGLI